MEAPVTMIPNQIKVPQQSGGVYNKLLKLFRLDINPSWKKPSEQVINTIPTRDPYTKKISGFAPEKFPDNVKQLKDWYFNTISTNWQKWKDRQKLWEDMFLLCLNSPHISFAVNLIADEIVQVDSGNSQPVMVEAKRKQKDFILKFFDKVKIYSKIRPTAETLIKYGNAVWILGLDSTGVYDIEMPPVTQLDERLEFTPYRVQEELKNPQNSPYGRFLTTYRENSKRIDQLIKSMTNEDNILSYFKSYLFGFVVGNQCLPPWRVLHFRNQTTESPFNPFGMPLYIYALAPFNKVEAAHTMRTIAQGMMFPKDIYEINIPNIVSPTEKFNAAVEFANLWFNSGINEIKKEQDGLGEKIFTIKGLYEYRQESPDYDLAKLGIDDTLIDGLILATKLPRNLIDPNDTSYGDSGVSLTEKFKPFARLVYNFQSIILDRLTQLVKIHMIQSRKFALDEINFSLSMPFPESIVNRDLVENQAALLDLANNIITNFGEKFFGGEAVPEEIIKIIYNKFLPYDDFTIQSWFKSVDRSKKQKAKETDMPGEGNVNVASPALQNKGGAGATPPAPAEMGAGEEMPTEMPGMETASLRRDMNRQLVESRLSENHMLGSLKKKLEESGCYKKFCESVEGITLKEKLDSFVSEYQTDNMREWKLNRRHFFSSHNINQDFKVEDLVKIDKNILKEDMYLNEEERSKLEKNERVLKYDFKDVKKQMLKEAADAERNSDGTEDYD